MSDESDQATRYTIGVVVIILLIGLGTWGLSHMMMEADYNGPPPRESTAN